MTVNAVCKKRARICFGDKYQWYNSGDKAQLEICLDGIRIYSIEFDSWSAAYRADDLSRCFCSYEDWGEKYRKSITNIIAVVDGKEYELGNGYVTYED